jgi:hypothetical protein
MPHQGRRHDGRLHDLLELRRFEVRVKTIGKWESTMADNPAHRAHRKIWPQPRLMRKNVLLSPITGPALHEGTITRLARTRGGHRRHSQRDRRYGLVFSAVDHFDACCISLHVVKTGNDFVASQPRACWPMSVAAWPAIKRAKLDWLN